MVSIIFLCALCFGTTVEALQTITHSDHLDVMHQPVYICILAGIDFLVWCLVFRCIGGYTFHQRTSIEAQWLKKNPHLPCPNAREAGNDESENDNKCAESCGVLKENNTQMSIVTSSKEDVPEVAVKCSKGTNNSNSFFDDPRHEWLNLSRDLTPCFILIITCLIVYLIDQKEYPNASKYVDPAMALLTIAFLIVSSIPIMKKSSLILLQSLPEEMENVEVLCNDLKKTFSESIEALHEVHVWCLVPNKVYATLHIVFTDEYSYLSSVTAINAFLIKYGINYTTIQPEFSCKHKKQGSSPLGSEGSNVVGDSSKTEGKRKDTNESQENNGKETVTDPLIPDECQMSCPTENCLKKRCCSSISSLSNIGDEP